VHPIGNEFGIQVNIPGPPHKVGFIGYVDPRFAALNIAVQDPKHGIICMYFLNASRDVMPYNAVLQCKVPLYYGNTLHSGICFADIFIIYYRAVQKFHRADETANAAPVFI